jgi:hypothetical protein
MSGKRRAFDCSPGPAFGALLIERHGMLARVRSKLTPYANPGVKKEPHFE